MMKFLFDGPIAILAIFMSAYPADSLRHTGAARRRQPRSAPAARPAASRAARLRWCISTSYKDWLKVVGSDTAPRDGGCSSHQPIMTCSKRALVRQWVSVSSSSAIPVGQIAQQRDLAVGAFQLHHRYVALAGGHQQLIIDAVIRSQPQFLRWVACRTIATCHSGWLSNSPTDRPSSPARASSSLSCASLRRSASGG